MTCAVRDASSCFANRMRMRTASNRRPCDSGIFGAVLIHLQCQLPQSLGTACHISDLISFHEYLVMHFWVILCVCVRVFFAGIVTWFDHLECNQKYGIYFRDSMIQAALRCCAKAPRETSWLDTLSLWSTTVSSSRIIL